MTTDTEGGAPASPNPSGIAILGSHPETKMLAPFDDPEWLIYACSPYNFRDPGWEKLFKGETPARFPQGRLPRVDHWFEVHRSMAHETRPYPYLRWLEDQPFTLWVRDQVAKECFPNARVYPEKELKSRFGPFIFTSSIAYMMAKAIVDAEQLGIKQIALFGIMQASKEEYVKQKTGTQQMIWEAKKAGIQTIVPEAAKHLLEPPAEDW